MPPEWSEKYRPRSLSEVVGNGQAIREMVAWANEWNEGIPKKRALILAGPPGIGKTTSALALANDMGWDVVEMNASDARNEERVRAIAGTGAMNQTFRATGEYLGAESGRLKLILMDEADSLYESGTGASSETGDKGGKKAIASIIKVTRHPIVLTVNDLYGLTKNAYGKAIADLSKVVKFKKPTRVQIKNMLSNIAAKEGFRVSSPVLDFIAGNSGGDIRGAVNDLQALLMGVWDPSIPKEEVNVTLDDARAIINSRDKTSDIFSALKVIFHTDSYADAVKSIDNIDTDLNLTMHWIAHNIPIQYDLPGDRYRALNYTALASLYMNRVFNRQQWRLQKYARVFMTAGIAFSRSKRYKGFRMFQFPTYLKMSSSNRGARTSREAMVDKLAAHLHMSHSKVKSEVLPYLQSLVRKGEEGEEVLRYLIKVCRFDRGDVASFLGLKEDDEMIEKLFTPQSFIDRDVLEEAGHDKKDEEKSMEEDDTGKDSGASTSLDQFI